MQVYNCFTDMVEDASGSGQAPPGGSGDAAAAGSMGAAGRINVRFRRLQPDEDRALATCNILVMEFCDRASLRCASLSLPFHFPFSSLPLPLSFRFSFSFSSSHTSPALQRPRQRDRRAADDAEAVGLGPTGLGARDRGPWRLTSAAARVRVRACVFAGTP